MWNDGSQLVVYHTIIRSAFQRVEDLKEVICITFGLHIFYFKLSDYKERIRCD